MWLVIAALSDGADTEHFYSYSKFDWVALHTNNKFMLKHVQVLHLNL